MNIYNGSMCDYECNKACKIDEYLYVKNYSSQKLLIVRLVLVCMDGILNSTETSLDDKKVTCEKGNYINHTTLLLIICFLLLVVIFISCCYYYIRDWIKRNTYFCINTE